MVMHLVMTMRQAPSTAAVVRGMSFVTIMTTTKTKTRMARHILSVRLAWAGAEPARSCTPALAAGRKRWPMSKHGRRHSAV